MNDVRLDPQQVPARAELLLAVELGEDAPGRPVYARLEPDGDGDGAPAVRIKVGAVLTRRLHAAEATETPAGAAYGNPLRGRPGRAPCVPIGSAVLARTDAADARGWRVYRVTPAGAVMYDEWIDDDPAPRRGRAGRRGAARDPQPRPSPGGLPDGGDALRGCHRALPRPPVQGDPTPSVDDVALTERLRQAGTLMGIAVVDHVIGRHALLQLHGDGVPAATSGAATVSGRCSPR